MDTGIEQMITKVIDLVHEDEVVAFANVIVCIPGFIGEVSPETSDE